MGSVRFDRAHSGVTIQIHEADLADLARLLLDGTIDVALTYDMYMDRNLRFEPLVTVRPYVLLSRDDPLAKKRVIRLKELTEKERLANRLELLLKVLPGGVVVLDGQGLIQEHNPTALDMLGEPLLEQSWSEVIQRAFMPRPDDGHDISLVDGRRVNISTCPLGEEPGQILLITDVSEMRQLQDRLSQQQRLAAMGETAA